MKRISIVSLICLFGQFVTSLSSFASTETLNADLAFTNNAYSLSSDSISKTFVSRSSPACMKYWTGLTSSTLGEIAQKTDTQQFLIPDECMSASAKYAGAMITARVQRGCVKPESDSNARFSECSLMVFFLRAGLIDQMTKPSGKTPENYQNLRTELLINKLVARFFASANPTKGVDWDDQLKIQSVLSRRMPQSTDMTRAAVVFNYAKLRTARASEKEKIEKKVKDSLTVAENLQPSDESLRELSWLLMIEDHNQAGLEKEIGKYLQTDPNSKIGLYYLSTVYWDKKDKEQTVKVLEKLKGLYPEDQRVVGTLAKAQTSNFGENIFSSEFSITFWH
jgi:hypothetical protein